MSNVTHNALLTATSAVITAYSIALIAAPVATLTLFDVDAPASSAWTARLLGAAGLGAAALAFFSRHIENMDARRAIDGGFLVAFAAGWMITMWSQYLQVMNALGWINVLVYGGFALAYFYFIAGEDRIGLESPARPA